MLGKFLFILIIISLGFYEIDDVDAII